MHIWVDAPSISIDGCQREEFADIHSPEWKQIRYIKHNCHLSLSRPADMQISHQASAWNFEWHINLLLSHAINIKIWNLNQNQVSIDQVYTISFSVSLIGDLKWVFPNCHIITWNAAAVYHFGCWSHSVFFFLSFCLAFCFVKSWMIDKNVVWRHTQVESVHILYIPFGHAIYICPTFFGIAIKLGPKCFYQDL